MNHLRRCEQGRDQHFYRGTPWTVPLHTPMAYYTLQRCMTEYTESMQKEGGWNRRYSCWALYCVPVPAPIPRQGIVRPFYSLYSAEGSQRDSHPQQGLTRDCGQKLLFPRLSCCSRAPPLPFQASTPSATPDVGTRRSSPHLAGFLCTVAVPPPRSVKHIICFIVVCCISLLPHCVPSRFRPGCSATRRQRCRPRGC